MFRKDARFVCHCGKKKEEKLVQELIFDFSHCRVSWGEVDPVCEMDHLHHF